MLAIFVKALRSIAIAVALVALVACGGRAARPAATGNAGTSVATPVAASPAERPETRPQDPAPDATAAAVAETAAEPEATGADGAVTAVPEEVTAAYLRALDAMAAEDFAAAIVVLEPMAASYPSLAGPWVNLAIAYRHQGRHDDAEAALEHALAADPEHPAANSESGVMHRQRGDFAAAEAAYRRAIAADPGYALAHYNLGVLLDIYLQRREEALEQYELYQVLAGQADPAVDAWVVDLRRRLGRPTAPVRLAQEDSE